MPRREMSVKVANVQDGEVTAAAAVLRAVAAAQVAQWLPEPCRVLDLSPTAEHVPVLEANGHEVLRPIRRDDALGSVQPAAVVADHTELRWLADASVDAVLAEGSYLSGCLAAEVVVEDVARVLRPGGRLLACVDSLLRGLASLAEQGRWAELADVPAADVVLVPGDEGITRVFWPEQLDELVTRAGLEVEWIRPRGVLSEETVARALEADAAALPGLVEAEMALAQTREGEPRGHRLVVAARRPA